MLPNNPNTQIGHKAPASTNGHSNERDYLHAQARLAKQDFQRAAKSGVKSARRLLNVSAWVERSPFGTLAAAFVVGYVAESCLGGRSKQSGHNSEQTEHGGDPSPRGRSSHRFIGLLIQRTLRQLIESSLIAWLFPKIIPRETESEERQSPSSEDAFGPSDTTSSPIEV